MAVLEIRKAGDQILKQPCVPVAKIGKKTTELLDNMAQTMYFADGVGLAAPQVGILSRLIVVDVGEGLIEMINPSIVEREGSENGKEGCLSIPGIYGEVERSFRVVVDGFDRKGKKIRIAGEGFLARALQHEIDHLDGILFIEKAQVLHQERAQ